MLSVTNKPFMPNVIMLNVVAPSCVKIALFTQNTVQKSKKVFSKISNGNFLTQLFHLLVDCSY